MDLHLIYTGYLSSSVKRIVKTENFRDSSPKLSREVERQQRKHDSRSFEDSMMFVKEGATCH